MSTIKPLVMTPLPQPNESLAGFILRTSEVNGYVTPIPMLRHAGMTENQIRSAWPPFEKLAQLYARKPEDFTSLGYSPHRDNQRKKHWRVLNHSIPAIYMNVKSSKICPECISELGYIEAFWDLRHAIACPVHKKFAITKCPSCQQNIKWLRQGLMICRCGRDLSELRGDRVVDDAILHMLTLIKSKLHSDLRDPKLVDRGFPISDIEPISFATLIGIIGRFGLRMKRNRYITLPDGVTDEMYSLIEACKVLERWPYGLYDYLETLPDERKKIESFNLQRQFHTFFVTMFKSGLSQRETTFLRKAFVNFGNERHAKQGFIDIRTAANANESRNIVGITGLAKYLGVRPPTVMSYVRKGLIKGQLLTAGKRTRRIFDLTKDIPFKPAEGRYYKQREAALFLGLPVNLLRELRRKGIYIIVRLGWGTDGYSELDLIEFRDRYINSVTQHVTFDAKEHITLGQILRQKRPDESSRNARYEFVTKVLGGDLMLCGRIGSQIKDIFLLKRDFNSSLISTSAIRN